MRRCLPNNTDLSGYKRDAWSEAAIWALETPFKEKRLPTFQLLVNAKTDWASLEGRDYREHYLVAGASSLALTSSGTTRLAVAINPQAASRYGDAKPLSKEGREFCTRSLDVFLKGPTPAQIRASDSRNLPTAAWDVPGAPFTAASHDSEFNIFPCARAHACARTKRRAS